MVAAEFLQQLDKLKFVQSVGLDDFADRCSYMLSFVVLLMCFTIVTLKSYVFEPLSCYVPTPFGSGINNYIAAFCWINGTVPIDSDFSRLEDPNYWHELESKKLNYYQWVSLVLALQAVMCYIPRLIWEAITFNRVGTNLGYLVEYAQSATKEVGSERAKKITFVANTLDTLLFARRKMVGRLQDGYRSSTLQNIRSLADAARDLLPRKRMGSALATYYFIIKLLYLGNAVAQVMLIESFVGEAAGKHRRNGLFGIAVLGSLLRGEHWSESRIFPRIGYCRVQMKLPQVDKSPVVTQCSLPVNMLNEKIYVFLWFWFCVVAALEVISLISWFGRLMRRQVRVRSLIHQLKVADAYTAPMNEVIERFEKSFLRLDGTFMLHMLRLNAGDIVTQEILQAMLQRYLQEEKVKEQRRQGAIPDAAGVQPLKTDSGKDDHGDCTLQKRCQDI